jgi:hypothetical protein
MLKANDDGSEKAAKKMKVDNTAKKHVLPNFVQTSLKTAIEKGSTWPDDHPITMQIDKSIMDLIIVDMLPYSLVEGEAFKRLNFADPSGMHRYRLKTEKFYRTTLMPATYEKVEAHVKKLLLEADYVSFTTDGWSNPTKTCSLLSFTAHFVHAAVRRKVILNAMVLDDKHTGVYIASKLQEAITKWSIETKIHVGVRDNAANMILAMQLAQVTDIGCMSHTLQLVLHDALFTQTSVESVVKKARKLVSHFKHSEQACRQLVACQASSKSEEHKLLQDVETRWNSTYLMLERLVEQRKAINLFSVECGGIDTLTNQEWELTERVVIILKPFYTATLEICSDDACISVAIPLIHMLNGKLQTTPTDLGLKQMKAALRDAMSRRFAFVTSSPPIIAATLLDPRFKDYYFNSEEKAAAMAEVLSFLRNRQTPEDPDVNTLSTVISLSTDNVQLNAEADMISAAASNDYGDLWDAHDNIPVISESAGEPTNAPIFEQQLLKYLKEVRVPRSTDIYGYWHCSQYPDIEVAARKYLSAPPTSVASEQLFSSAGQLYADRRSSLRGENAEKLLFLAYNIRMFGFNY